MSSHHIVREKQEPALLIANGASCRWELVQELLEWSPFIVVLDGAMPRVMELGIKVDVLLGDFDRDELNIEQIQESQYPIEVIHTPNQDKTDLEKGIEFLIERGFPAVNIVWATGRRADHTLANLTNIVRYKTKIKIVMLDDFSRIYPLSPRPARYEKWYVAGTPISLIPVGEATDIQTSNLVYNLNGEKLILGYRNGNSNAVAQDGIVQIEYGAGDLLVLECTDSPS
ncbi:MAG: thiamine diphosphokinase [Spirosomataceae bacterium]